MNKIIVIADSYKEFSSANGNCGNMIASELVKRGYEVFYYCPKFGVKDKNFDSNELHVKKFYYCLEDVFLFKKSCLYIFFKKLFSKVRNILFRKYWPINSPRFSKNIIKDINKKFAPGTKILGISRFCDAVDILSKLSSNFDTCLLNLDLLYDPSNEYKNDYYNNKILDFIKSRYQTIKKNIFLDYHKEQVLMSESLYGEKQFFVGLPFVDPAFCPFRSNKKFKKIIYCGGDSYVDIDSYRNIIAALPNYTFEHYGTITRKDIYELKKQFRNFKICGFVKKEELNKVQNECDFLLSFESKFVYSYSSKVFSYLNFNPPIICFCDSKKRKYLQNIGINNSIFLDYKETSEDISFKVKNFEARENSIERKYYSVKRCVDTILSDFE